MPANSQETIARQADTHFGYQTVGMDDKAGLVRGVFDSVANRYDLMNDVMSGGLHRLWKASLIDSLRPRPGMHLLDVAGGTGDIAQRFLGALPDDSPDPDGSRVTIVDINQAMISRGQARALDLGLPGGTPGGTPGGISGGINWVCGDAEALPIPDASVDAYTIAFGIRNVSHIDKALTEACRVLRPGGHFLCLEFAKPAAALEEIYHWYSFRVIPWLGGVVGGDQEAYQYLVESIRRFPDQATFREMIAAAGLSRVTWRDLSGGVAAIHSAWRI